MEFYIGVFASINSTLDIYHGSDKSKTIVNISAMFIR